jgi:LysM repeat protein
MQIKDRLFENPGWIGDYIQQYGDEYSTEARDILLSWQKHFIHDRFTVVRNLKKYSVLMSFGDSDTMRLYGIIGLNHPFADLFEAKYLPVIINATILPFKDMIIYDGMITAYPIRIGPTMRKSFIEQYNSSKATYGIIESLPSDDVILNSQKKVEAKKPPVKQSSAKDMIVDNIAKIIKGFCDKKLNDEFLDVCMHVLKKLSRKRPSPLLGGRANTWASGIVYAVASNNFVFDRSQDYYMPAQDIADGFGLSKSTVQQQATKISKMLRMSYFEPEYIIASMRNRRGGLIYTMRRYGDNHNEPYPHE